MKYLKEYIDWEEDWEEEDPDDPYKDYPEDFKEFLIKHNALEKFHKNMNTISFDDISIENYFKKYENEYWIHDSFDWMESPEEENYWGLLNGEWTRQCRSK